MRAAAPALALVLLPLALAGCAEAVHGPRVVTYSEDRFYVRHVPVLDSRASVEALAEAICADTARLAGLEDAYQFAPLDIRYATYRCVAPSAAGDGAFPAAAEPSPADGDVPPDGGGAAARI
ncbi:MAG: hypothetical protein U1E38_07315 [Rhodospirillales bacterium]